MIEEYRPEGELDKSLSSDLDSSSNADKSTVLARIEERLAKASLTEAERLVEVRGQILEQDAIVKNNRHRRFLEQVQEFTSIGFSLGAFTIGVVFIFQKIPDLGSLLIGVGLYPIAPKSIKDTFLNTTQKKANESYKPTERRSLVVGIFLLFFTLSLLLLAGSTEIEIVLIAISGITIIGASAAILSRI